MLLPPGRRMWGIGRFHHVVGAEQVDVHDRLEAVRADVLGERREIARRTRHEDVDRAGRLHEGGKGRSDRRMVADIKGIAECRLSPREFCNSSVDLLLASAPHTDPGAGRGEGLGDAEVDPTGAARDKDVAAGVFERRPHGVSLRRKMRRVIRTVLLESPINRAPS